MITDHPKVIELRARIYGTEESLEATLGEIERHVICDYTLADAIREGCTVTKKAEGSWVNEETACAMGAAYLAAKARGYL